MDASVRRDEMGGGGIERRSVHSSNAPAGFLDNERAGSHIPGFQVLFPEAIESSSRDVTEVERGRTQPPDGTRTPKERAEEGDEIARLLMHVVGEAGHEQRIDQYGRFRDRDGAPVHECALAALGGEELMAGWIVNGGHLCAAVNLESKRRAEDRQPVRVVRGA